MIWMIVVGLVVGVIAKMLMPGRDPGGAIITILIGIAGSLVAGFLGRSAGWYAEGQPAGFLASIVGAILLLFLYRALTGQARESTAEGLGRAASATHNIADGMQSTASYLKGRDFNQMGKDAMNICRRYPTQSLIAALAVGFLIGRVRSR